MPINSLFYAYHNMRKNKTQCYHFCDSIFARIGVLEIMSNCLFLLCSSSQNDHKLNGFQAEKYLKKTTSGPSFSNDG